MNKIRLALCVLFVWANLATEAQDQTENLNMGTYQLQFASASGESNRIHSFGGVEYGSWLFKSRFDDIIVDAGENVNNKREIRFNIGGEEKIRFDALGQIGIGTNDPMEIIEIKHSRPVLSFHVPNIATFKVGADAEVFKIASMDYGYGGHVGSFVDNDTQLISINRHGQVGIGTIQQTSIFSVYEQGHYFSVNPHNGGVDLHSTGNLAPHYQTDFSVYKGDIGAGELKFRIDADGNVGIGTANLSPSFRLSVSGPIRATEIKVETGWSDFVFFDDYDLKSLEEVEEHINDYGHLPDIPSAAEVEEEGIYVGEMNAKLLQKIEELTLYMIEMNKEVKELKQENEVLKLTVQNLSDQ